MLVNVPPPAKYHQFAHIETFFLEKKNTLEVKAWL